LTWFDPAIWAEGFVHDRANGLERLSAPLRQRLPAGDKALAPQPIRAWRRGGGKRRRKAREPALVSATSGVGGKKVVDRLSTKAKVEGGKSVTRSAEPNRGPP
jgi:hypothetical protein